MYMKTLNVKIIDQLGLHARPASKITNEASKYRSEVKIMFDGKEGNAKSLINLMSLGIRFGSSITISVNGIDEDAAIVGIEKVLREQKII